ncbi:glycosyltransferase family 4 protein [Mycolicibacterium llatzerense]|uniref:glycosyltransferase family 4 protein n=1 Tax=Mycolicibacterium llatzerense TaxID=280871 RepID=UPI0021B656D6|nr:glycosyltransferase family 4 protein [Mycolicibacterium llatzerense]MCT7362068.1 hypothetical protein [Mycolicibacterium llatzerense]
MKILLVTPYSPLARHDHAANDLAMPLVEALAPHIDLHVYAPGQRNGHLRDWQIDGVTFHAGSPVRLSRRNRLGVYPYGARASWSAQSTKETVALARRLRPDIVHAEYWAAVEPLFKLHREMPTSLAPHDVPDDGMTIPPAGQSLYQRCLDRHELAKRRRVARALTTKIDSLLLFSEGDRNKLEGSQCLINVAPPGLTPPTTSWSGGEAHVAAFGGAMWRLENESTAIHLARDIMPLVRDSVPDAQLRIFGARPTKTVRALGNQPGITVLGEVTDYDGQFCDAQVALAPSMTEAGILIKSMRAMAMGCPVVLNGASARPIVGLEPGVHALVGHTPREFADHVITLMSDASRAARIGQSARSFVLENYGWDRSVAAYLAAFHQLVRAAPSSGFTRPVSEARHPAPS